MRTRIIVLALVVVLTAVAPATAGKTVPLTVPQGERIAKRVVHKACAENPGKCRGARAKDCYSVNKFRVDCTGILFFGRYTCDFRVSVIATQGQQVRIALGKTRCDN